MTSLSGATVEFYSVGGTGLVAQTLDTTILSHTLHRLAKAELPLAGEGLGIYNGMESVWMAGNCARDKLLSRLVSSENKKDAVSC